MPAAPDDLHEWISFDLADEGHEARTWVFDATFLRSNYQCIYGAGCLGILDHPAPGQQLGCCSFGAHFVDEQDVADVVTAFVRLRPNQMQQHARARRGGFLRPGGPDDVAEDGGPVTVTRVVDGACIFLNRPGFAGGAGCALHIGALEAGERPLDWKPDVCWQVPIRLEHATDENGHLTSRLREWKRRDWGEGGAEFHWWCTESRDAHVGAEPVYVTSRDEIIELVGQAAYDTMVEQLERPGWIPLPHPAIRR